MTLSMFQRFHPIKQQFAAISGHIVAHLSSFKHARLQTVHLNRSNTPHRLSLNRSALPRTLSLAPSPRVSRAQMHTRATRPGRKP
jgi:hypothetical protein